MFTHSVRRKGAAAITSEGSMKEQQSLIFIRRAGSSVKGGQWNDFIPAQQDALDSYRLHGWKLVAAVGVHGEKALEGVLLYFSKES